MRALDRDYLKSELASLDSILSELSDERVFERFGMESRRRSVLAELEKIDGPGGREAQLLLSFTGQPVTGSLGIDSRFAADAVRSMQDLVSKVCAQRKQGTVRNPRDVPEGKASRLLITNVVHGSFGFELTELDRPLFGQSELSEAVDETLRLLASAKEGDESFSEAISEKGARVNDAIKTFLTVLQREGAAVRLRSDDKVVDLADGQLERAISIVESITVEDQHDWLDGRFLGVLAESRRFEMRISSGAVISGKAAPDADLAQLEGWFDRDCSALVHIVRTQDKGGRVKMKYTLEQLASPVPMAKVAKKDEENRHDSASSSPSTTRTSRLRE